MRIREIRGRIRREKREFRRKREQEKRREQEKATQYYAYYSNHQSLHSK